MHFFKKNRYFDDFSTSLIKRIHKLTRHHYILKSLGIFLQNIKSNLLTNEVTILLDFSKNFLLLYKAKPEVFIGKIPNVLYTYW